MRRMTGARGFIAISLAVASSFLAVSLSFAGPAAAAASAVVCRTLSGSVHTATLSNCSDVAGTGGSGRFHFKATTKITWENGRTTSLSPFTAKEVKGGDLCSKGAVEARLTGTVSADTTGTIEVGAKATGIVCATESSVVNAPGKTFNIG